MELRKVNGLDMAVSVLSLGCWAMGGSSWAAPDDEESVRTIQRSLDLGINLFDTHFLYGKGHSEEVLAKGLGNKRKDVLLSTKASAKDLSPESVRDQLFASMKRLKTDYIDIYFIHWPNRSQPLSLTMKAMEALRNDGHIRAVGVSNFDDKLLHMASKYTKIDIVQNPYNFIWRFIEEDVLPYSRENEIAVCTYSSLAQGLLSGTIRLNSRFDRADIRPNSVLWRPENLGKCLYVVERLRAMAVEMGVTVAQLALRWLIEQPGVTTSLVGALTVAEIEENTQIFDWELPTEVRIRIQEVSDELYSTMPYYYDMWGNWSDRYKRGPQREV